MAKLYGNTIQHPDKQHVAFALLEKDSGERVEIPVRIAHYNSLTAAKKLAYVLECAEYHSPVGQGWQTKKASRRAVWDADDKAAQEAKFIVRAIGSTEGGEVRVNVTHHGLTAEFIIANDPANVEANARKAFAEYEATVNTEKQALAAFNIG